jgi:hypothetical protein
MNRKSWMKLKPRRQIWKDLKFQYFGSWSLVFYSSSKLELELSPYP